MDFLHKSHVGLPRGYFLVTEKNLFDLDNLLLDYY